MTPRERFLAAVEFEEPDRVPIDCWITPQAYESVKKYLGLKEEENIEWGIMYSFKVSEAFLKRLHIDFRRVYAKPAKGYPKVYPDGTIEDELGIRYKWVQYYWEPIDHPLRRVKDVDEVEEIPWPDPEERPEKWEGLEKEAKELYEKTDYVIVGMPPGPWAVTDCAHYMRGFNNFLKDLILNPKLACAYMDKITELAVKLNDIMLDLIGDYVQVHLSGDDLGHQRGLFFSPEIYRKYIKPRHKKVISGIKKHGDIKVLFHCDGAIRPLIKDLIEIGVDILNPVQPNLPGMDPKSLKEEFHGKLCFHGGVDLQNVMSSKGTLEDVENEVKERIAALAPGGGYIFSGGHNIQPDSSPEKILLLYDCAVKYGQYPIRIS